MTRVYMDHNATTPLAEAVADRMMAVLREEFGNPSSVHHFGQRAKSVVDEARSAVAELIGGDPSEVIFTSGGTESDNFALRGAAEALEPSGRRHLVRAASSTRRSRNRSRRWPGAAGRHPDAGWRLAAGGASGVADR
jgi:cysteine desulfurase